MSDMDVGVQPLDAIMAAEGIKNHDLVAACEPGFINHKQVQKARKGRRLTIHMQDKLVEALNTYSHDKSYVFTDLFNYRGKKTL